MKLIQPYTPTALHQELARKRGEIYAHCQPIIRWGNKRVGHADRDMVLGLAEEKLPDVDQQHFEAALAMMRDLLKEIHAHFSGPNAPMHFHEPTGDADALLDYTRTGHNAKQAQIAGIFP